LVALNVIYAECHFAECHYAECHHADCHGAIGAATSPNISAFVLLVSTFQKNPQFFFCYSSQRHNVNKLILRDRSILIFNFSLLETAKFVSLNFFKVFS